jgi:hypothetical protein
MDRQRVLELALQELNRQKAGLNEEIEALRNELEGTEVAIRQTPSFTPVGKQRGRMRTAAERKQHSEKMKQYWAAKKGQVAKPAAAAKKIPTASAKVRTKTAAQKKALSLAMKKAWARRKKAAAGKAKAK